MAETVYEVAQIREIIREVGRFGGIMRMLFVAEKITPEGTETIAMSSELEWQKKERPEQSELEDRGRAMHTSVLQALLAEGWEPIGADAKGRVMALRRELRGDGDSPIPADRLSWQYTHPWRN